MKSFWLPLQLAFLRAFLFIILLPRTALLSLVLNSV